MSGRQLDDTAREIIAALQRDGRASYASLGKSVGLSEAATRVRVLGLIDAGLLKITCILDPTRFGAARSATIAISCQGEIEAVAEQIGMVEGVGRLAVTSGSVDMVAELSAESDDDLLNKVGTIRNVPGVRQVETLVHLKRCKERRGAG